MSKKNILIIGALGTLFVIILGLVLIFKDNDKPKDLVIYGNVDIRQVDLGFRVFGKLKCLYFEEGDFVKKGQLMAELDQVPYLEEVNKAKALKESIKARLASAQAKLNKRKKAISSSAISQEDFDDSSFNVTELNASFKESIFALERRITDYNDTFMRCPSDGIILTRIKEPGSIVSTQDAVYSLNICNPVWVRSYVSEPELGKIYFGQKALIYTDTEDLPVYHGHIGFISPVAEFTPKNVETTELRVDLVYRLRVIVDNPDNMLKQGMPVTIKLINKDLKSTKSYYQHQCH